MSLSFYYEFSAPATMTADELETFLHSVESDAHYLGFDPTTVLNVPFDTSERREFARRLGSFLPVQNERLKGLAHPAEGQIRNHDPLAGDARLIPSYGVVLVVTDEYGRESCFGFFHFPEQVLDRHGRVLAETGLKEQWWFRNFVDSPDLRYRQIVARFQAAGFAKNVKDEFA